MGTRGWVGVVGVALALGCADGATAPYVDPSTPKSEPAGDSTATRASKGVSPDCSDAGLSAPGAFDGLSPADALAEYGRRRSACVSIRATQRGEPTTIDYAIK